MRAVARESCCTRPSDGAQASCNRSTRDSARGLASRRPRPSAPRDQAVVTWLAVGQHALPSLQATPSSWGVSYLVNWPVSATNSASHAMAALGDTGHSRRLSNPHPLVQELANLRHALLTGQ